MQNIKDYLDYLSETGILILTEDFQTPIDDNVLNINRDWAAVSREYEDEKIVIIDDFLNPTFVDRLRHFKLAINSYHNLFDGGYFSIKYKRGEFWFPLLEKLIQDCEQYIPFLNTKEFIRGWSFLYEYECEGVSTHSDYESVNLNMWVTRDESILNSETHNGLDIWKIHPPENWDKNKSNNDIVAIEKYLETEKPQLIKIKHKCNRAVLFDSRYFHKTQGVKTLERWQHKRINYTMMWR